MTHPAMNRAITNNRRSLATLAAIAAAVAGCSSSGDAGTAVEPIEPILAGEIEIVPDRSATSATFSVETTIPVACAVIYGIDDSFGSIAVDNDMQGGAHEDHGPLLTGLDPDTEYTYVLQGSDAAGTIYRSDTMTFRTPPAVDDGVGENVATTATIAGVSSAFSDAFAAELAIDGDLASEWSSAGDGDEAWIEVDLGATREVRAIAFRTREMTDGSAITTSFTVTIDGSVFGPFPTGSTPSELDQPVPGRMLRFDAEQTTGGNTGATEIEIYAAP
jgi:hypothetical protein